MNIPPYSQAYRNWAPVVARWIFAIQFLIGAYFKIIWHSAEVTQTAAVGVPFAGIAVWLAFVLEVGAALFLIIGWRVRQTALVLAAYVLLLAFLFYRNVADPMIMGEFISHMAFIAGLLYVSVYGAEHVAISPDRR